MLDVTLAALCDVARRATDAAGYFPAMYARVTANVGERMARGEFDDDTRMERFVDAFAQRYLHSLATPGPRCWAVAAEAAPEAKMLVVQHLLLGINAHVNFDLPQTVVALAGPGALEPLRADFDAVNRVLAETYDELLGDLDRVTRWTGRAAAHGGGRLFRFSLTAARDQAWRTAERLWAEAPEGREAVVEELDGVVTALAGLVRRPAVPLRWLVPVARLLETRDPAVVTRRLLGPLA